MKKFILFAIVSFGLSSLYAKNPLGNWQIFTGNYSYLNDKISTKLKLPNNSISDICFDNSGNLIFASNKTGIYKYVGNQISSIELSKECLINKAEISAIACDSKNNIYVGTSKGLTVYNGKEWINYLADVTGLIAINSLAITSTDKVYVAGVVAESDERSVGGGLAFFNGEGWTKYNKENGVPDTIIQNITLDSKNHLWMTLGNHNKGIAKFDGKNWKTFNTSNGLPTNNIYSIYTNESGKVWFAAPSGILEYHNNEWKMIPFATQFGKKILNVLAKKNGEIDINSFSIDKNNTFWIGTTYNGVYALNENYCRNYSYENSPLNNNAVRKIIVDKNNNKWFCFGSESYNWLGSTRVVRSPSPYSNLGGIISLKEFGEIANNNVKILDNIGFNEGIGTSNSIIEDKTGYIWIANDISGLLKLGDNKYKLYQHPKGEIASMFVKGYLAPDNKIFLSTAMSGVKVFENEAITDFAKAPNMGGVTDITYDKENVIWASGMGGLSKYIENDWVTYNKKKGDLPSVIIYCVYKDSKNNIWAGTAKGLVQYLGGDSFKTYTKKEIPFPSDDITAIKESQDGKLWFGSKNGISSFDGTNWVHFEKIENLKIKNFQVNDISFDTKGNMWLATYSDGLLKFDGTNWTQINKENSRLIYDNVTAVKAASDNKVYISSSWNDFGDKGFYFETSEEDKIFKLVNSKILDNEPKHLITIIENK
jgi:ligand-binding sensor domain-containing protein